VHCSLIAFTGIVNAFLYFFAVNRMVTRRTLYDTVWSVAMTPPSNIQSGRLLPVDDSQYKSLKKTVGMLTLGVHRSLQN
jgi:hypothetical protein